LYAQIFVYGCTKFIRFITITLKITFIFIKGIFLLIGSADQFFNTWKLKFKYFIQGVIYYQLVFNT